MNKATGAQCGDSKESTEMLMEIVEVDLNQGEDQLTPLSR